MRVILFLCFWAIVLTPAITQSQETGSPPYSPAIVQTNTPVPVPPPYYSETPVIIPPVVIATSLYPNVSINYVKDNENAYPLMAVDQTTDQLYTIATVNDGYTVCGPYSTAYNRYQQFIQLQYARITEDAAGEPLCMAILLDHTIFVSFNNSVIRIAANKQTQKIDLPANTGPFQDLYEVKEQDVIPGTKPGDLLGISTSTKDGKRSTALVSINGQESPARFTAIGAWNLTGIGCSMCIGPDHQLYIAALWPFDGINPIRVSIHRIEKNGEAKLIYQLLVRSNNGAALQYLPDDQAFYLRTAETIYRFRPGEKITYDLFQYLNNRTNASDLAVTGDGNRLLFMSYVQQQDKAYLGINSLHVTGPYAGFIDPSTPAPTKTYTPTETFSPTPSVTPNPYTKNKRFIRAYTCGDYGSEEDPGSISALAFSPDGKSIYTSDWRKRDIQWNIETGEIQKKFIYAGEYPFNMYLSNDGKILIQEGQNYSQTRTMIWDIASENTLSNKLWDDYMTDFKAYDNGNKCIFGTYHDGFYLWDLQHDKLLYHQPLLRDVNHPDYYVFRFSISPQEKYCAMVNQFDPAGDGNNVTLWNIENQTILHTFNLSPKMVIDVQWVSNEKLIWFISWTRNGGEYGKSYLDLFDAETGNHLYQVEKSERSDFVRFTRSGDKYLVWLNKTVKIYSTFSDELLAELPHSDWITSAIFSPDEKMVLTGSNSVTGTAAARLWNISDLHEYPIPSLTPYTPTPTPTQTLTPTPNQPISSDINYKIRPLAYSSSFVHTIEDGKFAIDLRTEELIYAEIWCDAFYQRTLDFYKFPIPSNYICINRDAKPYFSYPINRDSIRDLFTCEDGTIIVMYWDSMHIFWPNGNNQIIPFDADETQSLHVVTSTSRIPGTKPGDVLLLSKIWKNYACLGEKISKLDLTDISKGFTPLIDASSTPPYLTITDLTEGPGGYLYILLANDTMYINDKIAGRTPVKILYWNENKEFKEWSHFSIENIERWFWYSHHSLHYAQQEGVFYLIANKAQGGYSSDLIRISNSSAPIKPIANSTSHLSILHSPSNNIYVASQGENRYSTVSEVMPLNQIPPTPTPAEPTPTPTPIAGWFVLDGFGGIHSTNPAIARPVLPYWNNFNIARDIEPDPLGRGWYMLDGFGGIHTSSPNLPKPDTLPYFSFDIACKLKVKEVNGKLEFYLLDGFGGIYSTDPAFDKSKIIRFGNDTARGLQLGKEPNEWILMDSYGTLYFSKNSAIDIIRFTFPLLISPIMRNFVRFPDDTTVMLDLFGGRHTNPYYPAHDVIKGLSTDFYFPGWDIVWDMEVVPENMAKRGH